MSNIYTDSLNKLRKLRSLAPITPRLGEIPGNASKSRKEVEMVLASAGLLGFLAVMLSFMDKAPIKFDLNFGVQIAFTVLCFMISRKFWIYALTFRFSKAFELIKNERIHIQYAASIVFVYAIVYLGIFFSSPLTTAWHNFFNNANEPYSLGEFGINSGQDFYIQWLVYPLLFILGFKTWAFLVDLFYTVENSEISKNTVRLWIGKSTGCLAKLSHGRGIAPKQNVVFSLRDAAQNILILGGTGSGKTTQAVYPLLLQLADQDCGGLAFNFKGDFYEVVEKAYEAASKKSHVKIIGEGGYAFNLIEGLTPETAATFLKSCLMLGGSQSANAFWIDTAAELCRHVLGILSFIPKRYNLSALYQYLFDPEQRSVLEKEAEEIRVTLDLIDLEAMKAYRDYLENVYGQFDERLKSGVQASVAQILSTFNDPKLTDMFCRHSDTSMEEVLSGTVFVVNLSRAVSGTGGKVICNLIKLRFFNVMQQRQSQQEWNQERPVFFLCDEYQEIVSGNKDGLSDLNFWDKSRSSNTIGIIASQAISSVYAAIGDRDMANALLQNFRQKICFKTEDQDTLNMLNRVTGNVDVEKRSISKQSGTSSSNGGNINNSNTSRSRTETTTWVTKPVIDPQLLRTLKQQQAIALLVLNGDSFDDVLDMMKV